MPSTERGRVMLSVSIDKELNAALVRTAAERSQSLSDFVHDVLSTATQCTMAYPDQPSESGPDAVSALIDLPTSVGSAANPNFAARDTDEYLKAHWLRDVEAERRPR